MNENWYWKLAQEQQLALRAEVSDARLRREAGVPDRVPGALKALGVVLIVLPLALLAVRVVARL